MGIFESGDAISSKICSSSLTSITTSQCNSKKLSSMRSAYSDISSAMVGYGSSSFESKRGSTFSSISFCGG